MPCAFQRHFVVLRAVALRQSEGRVCRRLERLTLLDFVLYVADFWMVETIISLDLLPENRQAVSERLAKWNCFKVGKTLKVIADILIRTLAVCQDNNVVEYLRFSVVYQNIN